MIENTLENKAKFFAQYWGQYLIAWNDCSNHRTRVNETQFSEYHLRHNWLELKPLSQITDEDAIQMADFLKVGHGKTDHLKIALVKDILRFGRYRRPSFVEFIRFLGYPSPWLNVSVEQQIEWGWIKLKEEEL